MDYSKENRLSYTERARRIVDSLTLEERVSLMSGSITFEEVRGAIKKKTKEHYNQFPYPAGGIPEKGIPAVLFCDGPRGVVCGNGKSTCFPVSMLRGASFDTDLEEEIGEAMAEEVLAYGGNLSAGVCINLPYNPGWGRSQETYGEDSFHLGEMGAALVRGIQKKGVIACVKHFAFNQMENARFKVNVDCTTIGSFLTLYYTDSVGISAAVIGTIMLLTRLLDGVTDLGMGALIDRTRTRWGKARPWVLWSAVPMGLGLVLLFNVPASLGSSGKIAYAAITYTLMAAVIYTACNLSYNTLLSLTAPNPKDRVLMSSLRFFCTMGVVLIINYNTMNLVERFGWNGMAFAFGVIAVVLLLITFFFTKERSIAGISGKSEKKIPVGQSFRLLFKNKYFIFVTLIFVINYTALGVNNGLRIFYARDVLGNAGLMGTLTLCFILPKMIGNLLYPQITRIMGKWKSLVLGYILEMAGVAVMALTPSSLGTAVAGLVLLGIGGIPHTAGLFTSVPFALFSAGLIIIMFTNIDKIYPQISRDLAAGRSEAGQ